MEKENNNSSMFYGAGPMIFELAKRLRNNVTDSEMLVWGNLKSKFSGFKFRRQHPIALYVADFYCHTAKLVIEIDGSIHTLPGVKENDAERQKYLEGLGLKVLRFSNEEISHNLESVLQVIEKNIKSL
jgi:imidazole glycerol-phosphate synthase subunit HisF